MEFKKVDGIISETKHNALMGFLKATLMAIVIEGGIIGYLWRDSSKCKAESAAKVESIITEYNIKLERRIDELEHVQSEVKEVKETAKEKIKN